MTTATVSASTDAWILTTNNDLPIVLVTGLQKAIASVLPGAFVAQNTPTGGIPAGFNVKYTGTVPGTYSLPAPGIGIAPITVLNNSTHPVTLTGITPNAVVNPGAMSYFTPNSASTAWVVS